MEVADQNQSPGGILQNSVPKNFAKFTQNTYAGVSFSIELPAIRQEPFFYGIPPGNSF